MCDCPTPAVQGQDRIPAWLPSSHTPNKGGSPVTTCIGPYLSLPMEDVLREAGVDEAVHFCQLCDVPQGHGRILWEWGHE